MLYLASESPRRHQILTQMGVAHQVLHVPAPPGEDEPRHEGEDPTHYVRRTAREKAERALAWLDEIRQGRHPEAAKYVNAMHRFPILTADTAVVLGQDILGKPADLTEAASLLQRLSGTTHAVHTAIVLALPDQDHVGQTIRVLEDESITQVRFKPLTQAEIQWYCSTGEPMGKAGAYGIQGAAAVFIQHLSGSYSGVMGLPIFETHRLLQQADLIATA